ncbi:MAG: DUF3768 domain-containing protein [Alphaproteobacteria bacterium]|nr:DUF3768 domain-containing protein [Alphaproteobacteria bacterium]
MNNAARIAALNDAFRANPSLETFVLTAGILTDMPQDVEAILNKVRTFKDFNENDDPYGEHDFGAFDFKGKKIFWKIDYYDRNFEFASPDAANLAVTNRVLTVMYADEY